MQDKITSAVEPLRSDSVPSLESDLAKAIRELHQLKVEGVLSESEFIQAKALLLQGNSASAKEQAPASVDQQLRQPQEQPVRSHPVTAEQQTTQLENFTYGRYKWVRCAKCLRAVKIPERLNRSVDCPACSYPVVCVDEQTKAYYLAEGVQPAWKQSWGNGLFIASGILAVISFIYWGNFKGKSSFDTEEAFIGTLMNPLLWVTVFLAFRWGNLGGLLDPSDVALSRVEKRSPSQKSGPVTEVVTPQPENIERVSTKKMRCANCLIDVRVPARLDQSVHCPTCNYPLVSVDEKGTSIGFLPASSTVAEKQAGKSAPKPFGFHLIAWCLVGALIWVVVISLAQTSTKPNNAPANKAPPPNKAPLPSIAGPSDEDVKRVMLDIGKAYKNCRLRGKIPLNEAGLDSSIFTNHNKMKKREVVVLYGVDLWLLFGNGSFHMLAWEKEPNNNGYRIVLMADCENVRNLGQDEFNETRRAK